ncbi:hypothetical protein JCM8097_001829 [Rhodosporidiobolus ruineniae]
MDTDSSPPLLGRTTSTPSSASPAQQLPYDILLEIFSWLAYVSCERVEEELMLWPVTSTSPTMRALPLVCRSWRDAGQSFVFRTVVFDSKDQCRLFLRSAQERPDLAEQVRAASVGRLDPVPIPVEEDEPNGDWQELSELMLECLGKCTQCRHIHVAPLHYPTAFGIFETIKRQPIPLQSLILRIFDAHRNLPPQDCIDFYLNVFDLYDRISSFSHFEINFRPPYLPTREEVSVPILPVSFITTFHSTVNSVEAFLQALRMMPHLRILNVYTEWAFEAEEASEVFGKLVHLEELRVESNVPITAATAQGRGGNPAGQDNFWLNKLLPTYPTLRILSVTEQDALPCQFTEPPPALEKLEFVHFGSQPSTRFFQFEELLDLSPDAKQFAACEFIFVADEEAFARTVDEEDVIRLVAKYAEKGVTFGVSHEILPLPEKRLVEI